MRKLFFIFFMLISLAGCNNAKKEVKGEQDPEDKTEEVSKSLSFEKKEDLREEDYNNIKEESKLKAEEFLQSQLSKSSKNYFSDIYYQSQYIMVDDTGKNILTTFLLEGIFDGGSDSYFQIAVKYNVSKSEKKFEFIFDEEDYNSIRMIEIKYIIEDLEQLNNIIAKTYVRMTDLENIDIKYYKKLDNPSMLSEEFLTKIKNESIEYTESVFKDVYKLDISDGYTFKSYFTKDEYKTSEKQMITSSTKDEYKTLAKQIVTDNAILFYANKDVESSTKLIENDKDRKESSFAFRFYSHFILDEDNNILEYIVRDSRPAYLYELTEEEKFEMIETLFFNSFKAEKRIVEEFSID